MASDLVIAATSEKMKETDWMKNIEICELVTRDDRQAKEVVKSVKKRLKSRNQNIQLLAVLLLEMLMNNCGDCIHRQVIDVGVLPILVKIVKKKNDFPGRERIFLLLDAMQTSLGGAAGKFPEYYAAYYDLVSAQVEFPQQHQVPTSNIQTVQAKKEVHPRNGTSKDFDTGAHHPNAETRNPDFSAIDKATSVLEVLHDVLDAIDPQNPDSASDEFTLDLVEQCSFQKQRLLHLIMTYRDEKVVSQAIELNEKLHGVLAKHDALLSVNPTSIASSINHVRNEDEEEEDADHLLRRLRKGKACATDQSEMAHDSFRLYQDESLRLPLSRPLCIESDTIGTIRKPSVFSELHMDHTERTNDSFGLYQDESLRLPPGIPPCMELDTNGTNRKPSAFSQLHMDQSERTQDSFMPAQDESLRFPLARPLCIESDTDGTNRKPSAISQLHDSTAAPPPCVNLPPPPSKHLERERFFKEKQGVERPDLSGHVRGLSLQSQDRSSSCGSSSDSCDRDPYYLRGQH